MRAKAGASLQVRHANAIAACFGGPREQIFRPNPAGPNRVLRLEPLIPDWIGRINQSLDSSSRIIRVVSEDPTLIHHGTLPLSDEIVLAARDIERALRHNDSVAVLCQQPNLEADSIELHYMDTKYANTRALRKAGQDCVLLSGVGLLVCGETEELVLLRRAANFSYDYERDLHVFGGALCPITDHDSLIFTAQRETVEESKIPIFGNPQPLVILVDEQSIGFLQYALVGITVTSEDVAKAEGNEYEGEVERVAFADLYDALTGGQSWVPSARASILTWLAFGAPLSGGATAKFGGLTSQELFEAVVGRTKRQHNPRL
jgi:hypothetical protein